MGPNELLILLSARQSGSWFQFRSCVDEVMPEENSDSRGLPLHQRIRLNLSRLAHVEFTGGDDGHDWRAAPPALAVANTSGGYRGILCGARSLGLLATFREASAALGLEITPLTESPDAMRISSPTLSALERIAHESGVKFQADAAASMLSVLDRIGGVPFGATQQMPFGKDMLIERFVVERHRYKWERIEPGRPASMDGLYRCTRWRKSEHYLRNAGNSTPISGQIGKFIVLNRIRRNVLRYDRSNRTLKLPAICRPPALMDRALHLCSGSLAAEEAGRRGLELTYENVPPNVASMAAELLGQQLI